MEQTPPDPERQVQPASLEPLSGPDDDLEAAVSKEADGAQREGSGTDTVRRRRGGIERGLRRGLPRRPVGTGGRPGHRCGVRVEGRR